MKKVAVRSIVLSAALVLAGAAPALAGWGPEPVQVHATTNPCPQVAACEDAANGAFVAWEESDGPLRVAHLLPSGDLDPAWPPFVVASTMGGGRARLHAIPDAAGGVFLTWLASESLFVQHVGATGEIPVPWPDRGRATRKPFGVPTVVPDGTGGLYVSWLQLRYGFVGSNYVVLPTLYLDHRRSDGGMASGWPPSGLAIGVEDVEPYQFVACASIAPSSDGGVWIVRAHTLVGDPLGTGLVQFPGTVQLFRVAPSGRPASGWYTEGIPLGSYPSDSIPDYLQGKWWTVPQAAQVAVADDGEGGAFVVQGLGATDYPSFGQREVRLHRVDATGAIAPGWPPVGLGVGAGHDLGDGDEGVDASVTVQPGGHGDAWVGHTGYYFTESPPLYWISHVEPGHYPSLAFSASRPGWELTRSGDGSLVLADFHPDGQYQYADDLAHVAVQQSSGPGFSEYQSGPPVTWYGDVGVTGLRDGGAILCWSQSHERFGIYAVRVNRAGLVTDAPPPVAPPAARLALRFTAGAGIRASLALPGTGEARLLLADVTGRAVARETFTLEAGAREWTLRGTTSLAPGLYFARVERGTEALTARVVVTR